MSNLDLTARGQSTRHLIVKTLFVDDEYVEAARAISHQHGRVLERDGLAIYTIGTAAVIEYREGVRDDPGAIVDVLSRFRRHPSGGHEAPIALASLPYELSAPTMFTIAKITVVARSNEPAYAIYIGESEELAGLTERNLKEEVAATRAAPPPASPEHFSLDAVIAHERYRSIVEVAIREIKARRLDKVVIAREVVVTADRPFIQAELLGRLRALHPSCLSFAINGFVGATPELLLRKTGSEIISNPLAGTMARSGDPDEDHRLAEALMSSKKEREEHRFVVEEIEKNLQDFVGAISVPTTPHILELRNVIHLASTITATLCDRTTPALEIASALHPTPAICGTPRAKAMRFIEEHEGLSRDRYAGLVGYTDANGDGEWWIGIRSAIIDGAVARMIAGSGIVSDSNPADEFAETQLKLQAMLAVLVRP